MKRPAFSRFAALGSLLAAACVSCAAGQIRTGSDPQTNFGKFRTYAWVPPEQGTGSSALDETIKTAVARELARKGMTEAKIPGQADVLVSYYAVTPSGATYGDTPGPWRFGPIGEVVSLNEGSLTIEFIDPKIDRDVWQGTATNTVSGNGADPRKVTGAVKDLMRRYPTEASS